MIPYMDTATAEGFFILTELWQKHGVDTATQLTKMVSVWLNLSALFEPAGQFMVAITF